MRLHSGRRLKALERRPDMARGQRKTIDEKITAKQEMIEALMTRVESEKRELEELYQEKRRKEEVVGVLQQYLDNREEMVS